MKMRRVVTGHDDQAKAVFVGDTQVEATTVSLMPGLKFLSTAPALIASFLSGARHAKF